MAFLANRAQQQQPGAPAPGAPAPGAPPQAPAPAPGAPAPEDTQVAPQDQEAYDKVVVAAMNILYDNNKASTGLMNRLKADAKNPAQSLADTVSMIIVQLDQQSGGKIPESVILPAAAEILEQVSELADSVGVFAVDEAVMNQAAQMMMVNLGEEYGTEQSEVEGVMASMSPEEMQAIEMQQGEYARKQPPIAG